MKSMPSQGGVAVNTHSGHPSSIKLNVGCGLNVHRGYENLDNSHSLLIQNNPILRVMTKIVEFVSRHRLYTRFPKCVRRWDVTRGLPYDDETVEVIYSSHTLEHLSRQQAEAFLGESYRVLLRGGRLRLALPDLELKARQYLEDLDRLYAGETDLLPADEFMRSTLLGVESEWSLLKPASTYRAIFARGRHYWMWDTPSLIKILRKIGFSRVYKLGFGESHIPEIRLLDLESRKNESFYVEALK